MLFDVGQQRVVRGLRDAVGAARRGALRQRQPRKFREPPAVEVAGEQRARVVDLVVGDIVVARDHFLFDRTVRQHDDDEDRAQMEANQVDGAHHDGLRLRTDDHRRVRGEPRQQLARLREQLVGGERRGREEVGDVAAVDLGELPGTGEMVDVVAIAAIGGNPARRSVGLGDVALPLEHRHVVADRCRRHAEAGGLGHGLRPDRLRALDVALDDRAEDRGLTFVELGHEHLRVIRS